MKRVSDVIVETLRDSGVDTIFLLSGGGMMHLLDAAASTPGVRYIAHHHEQAASIAADGYARRTGGIGACFATSGPGATNIVTGVAGAWQDSSPVVYVTGQSKVSQTIQHSGIKGLRQYGVFEIDIVPILESITKYAVQLDDPQQVRYHIERAIHEARSGRPGPVLLDVPLDIQAALVDPDTLIGFEPDPEPEATLDATIAAGIIERLRGASRPLLLAGHGVRQSGSAARFLEVAEQLGVPIVTTQLAKDLVPFDHDLWVGNPGVKGDRAGNFAVQTADVILTVGASLHVLTTGYDPEDFAPDAHVIHVDIDPAILQRQASHTQQQIEASVPALLDALASVGRVDPVGEWHDRCATWKKALAVIDEPHKRGTDAVDYYDFTYALSAAVDADMTVTTDAGSAFYVLGQCFRSKPEQRVIISGSFGAMGYALPAATGAACAAPGETIVCVTGDGSLQMNVHELAVVALNQLDVKVIVMNNSGYVSIRNTQRSYFGGHEAGVDAETGVGLPKLELLAAAYGLPYVSITSSDDLEAQLRDVLHRPGPLLCDIRASSQQELIPTVSSQRLDDGTMVSKPLHDMAPYLPAEELEAYTRFD